MKASDLLIYILGIAGALAGIFCSSCMRAAGNALTSASHFAILDP
jgi:hypothetical protein